MNILDWLRNNLGDKSINTDLKMDIATSGKKIVIKNNQAPVTIIQIGGNVTNETLNQLGPMVDKYENKELYFLAEEQDNQVKKVVSTEDNPESKGVMKTFKGVLSEQDMLLLRTGLYIRQLTKSGGNSEEIQKIKHDVWATHGERANNIVNLSSAGYYSNYFRVLYKDLIKQNAQEAKARFLKEHEDIIKNMSLAIFVNSNMGADEVTDKVIKLALRNITYGVTDETITLHAIGQNVKTVEESLKSLRIKFSHIKTKRPLKNINQTVTRIYYKENSLTEEDKTSS